MDCLELIKLDVFPDLDEEAKQVASRPDDDRVRARMQLAKLHDHRFDPVAYRALTIHMFLAYDQVQKHRYELFLAHKYLRDEFFKHMEEQGPNYKRL